MTVWSLAGEVDDLADEGATLITKGPSFVMGARAYENIGPEFQAEGYKTAKGGGPLRPPPAAAAARRDGISGNDTPRRIQRCTGC